MPGNWNEPYVIELSGKSIIGIGALIFHCNLLLMQKMKRALYRILQPQVLIIHAHIHKHTLTNSQLLQWFKGAYRVPPLYQVSGAMIRRLILCNACAQYTFSLSPSPLSLPDTHTHTHTCAHTHTHTYTHTHVHTHTHTHAHIHTTVRTIVGASVGGLVLALLVCCLCFVVWYIRLLRKRKKMWRTITQVKIFNWNWVE